MDNIKNKNIKKCLKPGFSIIEIVIVLAIGAMILAMAMGGAKYLESTRVTNAKTKLTGLDMAIQNYHTEIGQYPTDLAELYQGPTDEKLKRKFSSASITEKDLLDPWGKEFVYELNAKGSEIPYDLYSGGKSGKDQIRSTVAQG